MRRTNALAGIAALAGGLAAGSQAQASIALPNLGKPLRPPARGPVRVGVVMGPNLVAIDMFGPWTAFGDGNIAGNEMKDRFELYGIAPTAEPLDVDGLMVRPQYTFANAPQPHVLVVPAQKSLPETIAYLKRTAPGADVTMSVCTGAFVAARAGLFDGLAATTHHGGYDAFAQMFPRVRLIRGVKYVETAAVSSAGGETSGIDLALRVVERYYGADVARGAAYNMEYRRIARPQEPAEV
ncbi:MAG TPA: hypothetical protein VFE70_04190 [Candidatus Elarobacter sp.]|nr:hypothetical protein [Candidatus Elarobacter sp.]